MCNMIGHSATCLCDGLHGQRTATRVRPTVNYSVVGSMWELASIHARRSWLKGSGLYPFAGYEMESWLDLPDEINKILIGYYFNERC